MKDKSDPYVALCFAGSTKMLTSDSERDRSLVIEYLSSMSSQSSEVKSDYYGGGGGQGSRSLLPLAPLSPSSLLGVARFAHTQNFPLFPPSLFFYPSPPPLLPSPIPSSSSSLRETPSLLPPSAPSPPTPSSLTSLLPCLPLIGRPSTDHGPYKCSTKGKSRELWIWAWAIHYLEVNFRKVKDQGQVHNTILQ